MADQFRTRTLKRKNVKGLALNATPKPASKQSEHDAQFSGNSGILTGRTDTLEIGLEFRLDLRSEDLVPLKELGAGNGGTVSKVMHATSKVVMARKIIRVDAKENVRKQILRELQVGHDCKSQHIVTFYGAFQNDSRDIVMCMEYMDCGSLDRISKDFGPIRVDVLGKITESVLAGLVYLYETHRIMHRDIKPSNILLNSQGNIKLCDFGVATETVNSIADTFVGTSTYMAPERIQGGAYTVRSDVWSVGLTVMELAVGRFPFDNSDCSAGNRASAGPMGILDLLQQIVHEPAPKLPRSDAFPSVLHDFVAKCLLKRPDERPTPRELYDNDAFLQAAKRTPVDLQEWAVSLMDRHNRKSHMAPPAPKSLKDVSRANNKVTKSTASKSSSRSQQQQSSSYRPSNATPTSAEIPVNNIPGNDRYQHHQQYNDPSSSYHYSPSSSSSSSRHARPTKSPVSILPPSLEQLSLEGKNDNNNNNDYYYYQSTRQPRPMMPRDPSFASDVSQRPPLPSHDSYNSNSSSSRPSRSRTGLQSPAPTAQSFRSVLPPGGSGPVPVSADGTMATSAWRGRAGYVPTQPRK